MEEKRTSSEMRSRLRFPVRVSEDLIVVITTAAAALVVNVFDDGVLVVVVFYEQRHVDDDFLVAAAAATSCDQRYQLGHTDKNYLKGWNEVVMNETEMRDLYE